MTDLRKLSEAATPGEWRAEPSRSDYDGSVAAETNWNVILVAPETHDFESEAEDAANAAFIVALVNAFRSGSLIPRAEHERVLALLAEARQWVVLSKVYVAAEERAWKFGPGDNGKPEPADTGRELRATLSRIDDALAAEPEASE